MKLNLGCGSKNLPGYINVDHPRTATAKDVAHDLEKLPWPFEDNSADEILMQDALEHLTFPDEKINEVHRILKPGGVFWGGVPYAHSDGAVQALEHRWFFTEKSFDYLCEGRSGYVLGKPLFRVQYIRLATANNTPKTKLRNLIPFRSFLRHWLRNMYDEVEFKLIKI
jgi:ubiquinone/menaquinone biosynthesis C-methylase UbiE